MMKVHIVGESFLKVKEQQMYLPLVQAFYAKDAEIAVNNVPSRRRYTCSKKISREFLQVLDRVSGIIVEDDEMSTTVVLEGTSRDIPIIYNAVVDAISIIKTGSFITNGF